MNALEPQMRGGDRRVGSDEDGGTESKEGSLGKKCVGNVILIQRRLLLGFSKHYDSL